MSVLKENTDGNIQPIIFPVNGWCNDLLNVPKITEQTVETYYTSRTASRKHYNRSYKFLTESYIESVKTSHQANSELCFIKGKCFKSQKKSDSPYTVMTAITKQGEILDSNCCCPVGIGGFCNHLVALLRLVVILKKKQFAVVPNALSCTDVPQQWNRPRSTSLNSVSVMDVDWRRPQESGKTEPIVCKIYQARKIPRTKEEFSLAMTKFSAALRGDGLHIFSDILEDGLTLPYVATKLGSAKIGSTLSHQASSEESGSSIISNLTKYPLERSASPHQIPFKWPVFVAELPLINTLPAYFPLPEKHLSLFEKININLEEAEQLENETKGQAESEIWKSSRKFRITSSRFGSVCNRVMAWNRVGVRNIVSSKSLDHLTAIKYGRKTEPIAAAKYVNALHAIGHPVKIFPCGLVIDPQTPWIGASPDRGVYDPRQNPPYGLLEIKCPYAMKGQTPKEACAEKSFYVELNDDKPTLKDKNYLCQVIGQLGVTGLPWCDFVVYFPSGLIIERIFFDASKWCDMKKKLNDFYFEQMLPFMSN